MPTCERCGQPSYVLVRCTYADAERALCPACIEYLRWWMRDDQYAAEQARMAAKAVDAPPPDRFVDVAPTPTGAPPASGRPDGKGLESITAETPAP